MSVMAQLLDIYAKRVSVYQGYASRGVRPPFAKVSGVDHSSIWAWRTGRSGARLDTFEAVANALGYRLALVPMTDGTPRLQKSGSKSA